MVGLLLLAAESLLCGWLGVSVMVGGPVAVTLTSIVLPMPLSFRADSLSALFLLLLAVVPLMAGLHAHGAGLGRRYFACFLLLTAAMAGVVTAADWVMFLLAWELMTLASYLLVLEDWRAERGVKAAWVYLLTTHVASSGILVAATAISMVGGDYSFATSGAVFLSVSPILRNVLAGLFALGFLTKAGVWPFSFWLPEAYAAAPSQASAAFSGLMAKMGIYGLIRLFFFQMPNVPAWGVALALLGAAAMLVGNIRAMSEQEAGRLVAQSSIGQIGYVLFALGMAVALAPRSPGLAALAFAAGVYHLINHAAFKSLLFLTVGSIRHAAGTVDLRRLGGLVTGLPVAAMTTLVGALAIAGTPPLNGFASKWLIYRAAVYGGPLFALLGVVAIFMSTVSLAAYLKYFGTAFLGDAVTELKPVPRLMAFSEGVLAVACLALGLAPRFIVTAALNALPAAPAVTASEVLGGLLGAGAYQPVTVLLAVALCAGLAFGATRLGGRPVVKASQPWYGGEALTADETRYGSAHLYLPFQAHFAALLKPWLRLEFQAPAWLAHLLDADAWLFRPITKAFLWLSEWSAGLQRGRVRAWLAWQLLTVVGLLALLLTLEGGV